MLKKIFSLSGLKISFLLTLAIAFLNLWTFLGYPGAGFIDLLDKKVVDFVLKSRKGKLAEDSPIAIASIDTKSVDMYGRWPWSRDIMAKMVRELRDYYQVQVIGFDIVFSEPDATDQANKALIQDVFKELEAITTDKTRLRVRRLRRAIGREYANDAKFAMELAQSPMVVNGYFFFPNKDRLEHLTEEEIQSSTMRIQDSAIGIIRGSQYLEYTPLPEAVAVEPNTHLLSNENNLQGYFNIFPDSEDGTVRRVHLVMKMGKQYYPSLDLQIIRRALGDANITLIANEGGIEAIDVGGEVIDTNSDGSFVINYMGPAFTFPHFSIYDIINHKVDQKDLMGRIVLIGATEVGVYDLRTTPVGVDYPGVEVHANILYNIIMGNYFRHGDFIHLMTLVLILFLGLITGIAVSKLRPLTSALIVVVLLGSYWGANLYMMETQYTYLSFVYISLAILLNWIAIMLYKYFGEEQDKRFIKSAFGQYLSPKVIDQLVQDPKMLKLGGEKKILTAFFSDIQGFSTVSESLTPEELVELLNEYLTRMTDIIMKHGGTVDKFEGDAIIAFFGAPLDYPDHALKACLCSMEMQNVMEEMRANWKAKGMPELYMRIGLNTGSMVVGNMGSAQRMDYTMMGDSVNLAARLEGVNKMYQTYTMISEFTAEKVRGECFLREMDTIQVVGKNEAVRIYELIAPMKEVTDETKKPYLYYEKGLKLYREGDFAQAKKYFAQCIKLKGDDGPSKVLYNRCQHYLKQAPKNWDGVHRLTSK